MTEREGAPAGFRSSTTEARRLRLERVALASLVAAAVGGFATGPSMIGTPRTARFLITLSSGTAAMRQKSSAPGTGCVALGSNSLPFTCRLNFCSPNLSAIRPWPKDSSCMPSTCV